MPVGNWKCIPSNQKRDKINFLQGWKSPEGGISKAEAVNTKPTIFLKRPIQLCHRWSHRQYKLLSDMFRQELKTFWSSESFPLPPPLISLLIGNDKTPDKPLFRRSRLIKDRNGDSGGHFSFPAEEEDCSMGHLTALVLTLVVYLSLCDGAPTTASSEDHQIAEVSTQMPYMYSYVSYLIYTLML